MELICVQCGLFFPDYPMLRWHIHARHSNPVATSFMEQQQKLLFDYSGIERYLKQTLLQQQSTADVATVKQIMSLPFEVAFQLTLQSYQQQQQQNAVNIGGNGAFSVVPAQNHSTDEASSTSSASKENHQQFQKKNDDEEQRRKQQQQLKRLSQSSQGDQGPSSPHPVDRERRHGCEFCDKRFFQKRTLTAHRRIHTGEKPFKCPLCPNTFKQATHRNCHVKTHDPNYRPYVCQTCGRAFARKYSLSVHSYIHAGIFPFKCGFCDKKFRQSADMRRHEMRHLKPLLQQTRQQQQNAAAAAGAFSSSSSSFVQNNSPAAAASNNAGTSMTTTVICQQST